MSRSRRVLLALLAAYAASMTLLASQRSAEALLYRRLYELFIRNNPTAREPGGYPLLVLARDYGLDLTRAEVWSLRIADVQGPLVGPAVVVFLLIGLGFALIRIPPRSRPDKD